MKHRFTWIVLLAAACTVPVPAQAPAEIVKTITLETFQQQVQAMGFECTRGKDATGKPDNYFIFKAEGHKVVAFVTSPTVIELDQIFTDVHPTPATLNEWNSDNRFSHAYIQKDGTVDLEDDLSLDGGVTHDRIESFVTTFRNSVVRWSRFVVDHEEKK